MGSTVQWQEENGLYGTAVRMDPLEMVGIEWSVEEGKLGFNGVASPGKDGPQRVRASSGSGRKADGKKVVGGR